MYYQVNLITQDTVGLPLDLPNFLIGLEQSSLQDLSWADPNLGFENCGLWPIVSTPLPIDTTVQVPDGNTHYVADPVNKVVVSFQGVRAMTADELTNYTNNVNVQNQTLLNAAVANKLINVTSQFNTIVNNGAVYKNKTFQIDAASRANIDAASLLATIAIMNGLGNANDLRWANPNVDFGWIASDNTVVSMDAPSVVKFGQTMAGYYTELVFTARAIKNAIGALTDTATVNAFDVTQNWPSSTVG